ncbi:tRNA nucleotidyltransferase poly(A) polymerase [Pediococcus argentinicus]|uniref:CCA-adding enzyme n=2 Tax=Pediococcus argentinicus TaxID=480391 RepID=A0A0R2NKM1_9LACO|nr:tRNA nucleotidyltransferase poly(A) polymerase [Pediococcus argentinicus]NKZ21515.1 CCA tRNA nucleotidyltransferase [Pediococcus argentinicus]
MPHEFEMARPILRKIEEAGFEAYFVGGSVRDTVLNKKIHDVDIATSAYPEEIKGLFQRTVDTGIKHGTVMVLDGSESYEITTFRTESGYQDFRRPDHVTFVRSLSEDLKRRDFTINALALKEDGTIIDLFNGLSDLEQHLIKAVGDPEERFNEDALRMMRAVRFASQLNFSIEEATQKAILDHAPLLKKIAVERIQVEFEKLLMGQQPQLGIQTMLDTNLDQYCPDSISLQESLKQMVQINQLKLDSIEAAWVMVGWYPNLSNEQLQKLLKDWKLPNSLIKTVEYTIQLLQMLQDEMIDQELIFNAGEDNVRLASQIALLLDISDLDIINQYQMLPIKSGKELAVTGGELIKLKLIQPGPKLGLLLNDLKKVVIHNQVKNTQDDLVEYVKKWKEQ